MLVSVPQLYLLFCSHACSIYRCLRCLPCRLLNHFRPALLALIACGTIAWGVSKNDPNPELPLILPERAHEKTEWTRPSRSCTERQACPTTNVQFFNVQLAVRCSLSRHITSYHLPQIVNPDNVKAQRNKMSSSEQT